MIFRRTFCGPEFWLSLIAFAVSLSNEAIAQTNGDSGNGTTSTGTSTTTTTEANGAKEADAPAASATGEVQAETAQQGTTAADAKVQAPLPPQPPAAAAAAPPLALHEGHAEPQPTSATGVPLTVEILPGSGYPEPRTRGIVGGSMWLTMHGLQFPYMAPETSRNGVRLAVSGSIWDDTSYARLKSGRTDLQKHMTRWYNQGRAVVRFTPSYVTRDGWFVMGQVETVANIEQTAVSNNLGTADDVFVRAGKWNLFDVTVGRYQGWEIYHYGMGLDLNTLERNGATLPNLAANTQIYGVSTYWDRPAFGVGNYALHLYPTDYLRFEILGQIGTQGSNVQATRPVAILDLGFLKVKAGWEYGVSSSQLDGNKGHTRTNGFGGAVQFVWNPYLEGGVSGAIGNYDYWIDTGLPKPEDSTTTRSFGAFMNGRVYKALILGVGANQTRWNNLLPNGNPQSPQLNGETDWSTHFQGFGAVQYSFWNKMFFKFVANYARFHYEDIVQVPSHSYSNEEWGGRLRMMYLF